MCDQNLWGLIAFRIEGWPAVLVSRRLPSAAPSQVGQLVSAIRRLIPEDRLLARDCQRYLLQRQPPAGKPRLFAAGFRDDEILVARANWRGEVQPLAWVWKVKPHLADSPFLLAIDQEQDSQLFARVVAGTPLAPREFPHTDNFQKLVTVRTLPGAPPGVAAAARSDGATWFVESRGESLVLIGVGSDAVTFTTRSLPPPPDEELDPELAPHPRPVSLHARGTRSTWGSDRKC